MIGPLTDPRAHGGRRRRLLRRRPVDPGLRVQYAARRPRLDHGPGRPDLRHPDASPRVRRVRLARLRRGRDGLAGARPAQPSWFPWSARVAAVLLPVGRPGRVREVHAGGLRGAGAPEVVPVGRWLQRDQLHPAADRRRRLSDSPVGQLAWNELFNSFGNGTSLVTRDQILTEVSLYWFTNTSAAAGRYHYEEAHAGTEPQLSNGRPVSRSSPTTSRRSVRWPSATTPTSSTGRTSRTAVTTPRWRCPSWSSVTCGCSSLRRVRPGSPTPSRAPRPHRGRSGR